MIKATVKAGAEFQADNAVTVAKLNALGTPTVDISGTVESIDIASEAVTTAKLQQQTETADGAVTNSVVADAAAISLSKLEAVATGSVLAGSIEGKATPHELVGDVSLTRARKIPFDNGGDTSFVTSLAVGQKIRIRGTDGVSHLGAVVKVEDPTAFYKPTTSAHGDIQDNSAIHNQPTTLVYVSGGQNVTPGDTITGAGGASGIVKLIDGTTLTLRSVDGFFNAGEALTVLGAAVGVVGSGSGYEIVGYVNGANASELTDILVSTVSEGEDIGATVRIEDIKPDGISGQVLTSNGDQDAPNFQAISIVPAVAMGMTDTRPAAQEITGENQYYIESKVDSVSSSYALGSTASSVNDNFARFQTGDRVILSANTANPPSGAALFTIYFWGRVSPTSGYLYDTHDNAEGSGSTGRIPITSHGTNTTLCRYIAPCAGSVGGYLFPWRIAPKTARSQYIVVFNEAITNYVLNVTGNQIYEYDAESQFQHVADVGVGVVVYQTAEYCTFKMHYLHGNSSDYTFRYMSLIAHAY